MGSAAAAHLARRGRTVLGLEAFSRGHTLGSSHGETRIIRMAYFEHPNYVPLLKRAWHLWRELETLTHQHLLLRCGGLFIGAPDGDLIVGSRHSAETHGLPHELLDATAIRARFPQFQVREDEAALFENQAGMLRAEASLEAQTELALASDATLRWDEPVREWHVASDGQVSVRTDAATYTAERLVITAGAWSSSLLADVDLPLQPERIPLFWVEPQPGTEHRFGPQASPVWIWQDPRLGEFFGIPHLEWPGVKIGKHHTGVNVDPDTVDREIGPDDDADVRRFLSTCVPDLTGPTLSAKVCLYTNTPDKHFVIDRHPRYDNVVFAAGFSGHGFKFAPVIGEILADLAIDGRTRAEAEFLRLKPGRFVPRAASSSPPV